MAFHAIKAGEGDVFISAGVETVSRFAQGQLRQPAGHHEPGVRRRQGAHRRACRRAVRSGPTRARRAPCRTPTSRWARPRRTSPSCAGVSRQEHGRVRRPQPEPRREGDQRRLLGPRDHPGDDARRDGRRPPTTVPAPASPWRRSGPQAGVPTRRTSSRPATAARSTTAPPPWSS